MLPVKRSRLRVSGQFQMKRRKRRFPAKAQRRKESIQDKASLNTFAPLRLCGRIFSDEGTSDFQTDPLPDFGAPAVLILKKNKAEGLEAFGLELRSGFAAVLSYVYAEFVAALEERGA
jgi:hypothetical protein